MTRPEMTGGWTEMRRQRRAQRRSPPSNSQQRRAQRNLPEDGQCCQGRGDQKISSWWLRIREASRSLALILRNDGVGKGLDRIISKVHSGKIVTEDS
ncbi:hypothetical protein PIB30_039853 [Stylosanthes scabra]|uniref:Uncharacterized protein n=1 Tax=Stylosanthes scabra TaxID=79078 RepID=A0ABU6UEY0_9FABA|nr:hypothetical protein [Stylosanthes scabra]